MPIPDIFFPIVALTIGIVFAAYSWRRSKIVALFVLGWAILSLFIARIPFFADPNAWSEGDIIGYNTFNALFLIPVIGLVIASWRSAHFQQFMSATPTWILTATQLYRLSGGTLLILYMQGLIPAEIGLFSGVMDIIIGALALPLAWTLYKSFSWSRKVAIVWNIVGLLDFVGAATVITVSFFGLMEISPVPARMGIYPLSLITIYQVAIATFIHIYLLNRLFRQSD